MRGVDIHFADAYRRREKTREICRKIAMQRTFGGYVIGIKMSQTKAVDVEMRSCELKAISKLGYV